ncbi:hypothetical protein H311_01182 [Anncaliia algerae PRA109]|nr:hypothetical protein H311_01182 [Anncaliia algerae PRA109]
MNPNNNEIKGFDMASPTKAIPDFSGSQNEDVFTWIKTCLLIGKIAGLCEKMLLSSMLLHLRGEALIWATRTFENFHEINVEIFINNIKERFAHVENSHKVLEKFLKIVEVENEEQYKNILRQAEFLIERNCLTLNACLKMLISRVPLVLKPILLHAATSANTWDVFYKTAQDVA